ncbi:MAG: D-alanyl-D-alanine carboxypeptidase/D-alanyl-D-alanine-endopeptidase [Paludibacteraceae bacterium]|nr:D-alanyl-D-alanine carboxypeptidase/D-alanyl-D-alanine-endopeptidase [Paludibacteraceae bacterium]
MKYSILAILFALTASVEAWANEDDDFNEEIEIVPDSVWATDTLCQGTPLYKFVNSPFFYNTNLSILVKEIGTGKRVAEYRSRYNLIPASVTKVVTTASALEILSDTFRFKTRLEYDGEIKNGILYGNLYVKGGGDPTLASNQSQKKCTLFANFTNAVQKKGIKKIEGQIVGDASLYEEEGGPGIWLVEDIGTAYSPSPSALSFYDNLLTFTIQSDNSKAKVSNVSPGCKLFHPQIEMDVQKCVPRSKWTKMDYSWSPIISGRMAPNTKHGIRMEIPEPALFVADSLSNSLQKAGIVVTGSCTTQRVLRSSQPRKLIATYQSETLGEICKPTNHKSINLYAENIFSQIGLKKEVPSTKKASAEAIALYWKKKGLSSSSIFQTDGSGLSMKNAINSEFLVEVLTYMQTKSKYRKAFYESLPVAGVSGTVKYLMAKTPLAGKVHAKSGSMERVQNYCGYIQQDDRMYAFSIMINNFAGPRSSAKLEISRLLNGLMQEEAKLHAPKETAQEEKPLIEEQATEVDTEEKETENTPVESTSQTAEQ